MNKLAIGLISGIVGAITGAIGGYIFCKRRYEDRYYEEVHAAIEEEIQHLKEVSVKTRTSNDPVEKPHISEKEEASEPTFSDTYHEAISRTRLEMAGRPRDPDEPDGPNEDEQFTIGHNEPSQLLTQQEFENLSGLWHYSEWEYLLLDGTVIDENDQLVEMADLYLGDCVAPLVEAATDGDEIFVIAPKYGEAVRLTFRKADYEEFFGEPRPTDDDPYEDE